MALTLQQIQDNITNGGDIRQIINQLADYIEANPGGGSGGGVGSVTGDLVDNSDPLNPVVDLPNPLPAVDGSQLTNLPSSPATTIYNGDGQLNADRNVDLNTHDLKFTNGNVAIGGTPVDDEHVLSVVHDDSAHFFIVPTEYYGFGGANNIYIDEAQKKIFIQGGSNGTGIINDDDAAQIKLFASNGIAINNQVGADGSFVAQSGETITVTKGIITAITPP